MAEQRSDALTFAVGALERRDLSRKALEETLAGAGIASEERAIALARLSELGLLDDGKLARSRAEHLAERGLGDLAIAARLDALGLDRCDAEEAIRQLEPEADRAAALARGLAPGDRRRFLARLARRGFGVEALERALAVLDAAEGRTLA